MLRLERSSRDKLINIFVREKERFLSRPLVIAFAIAFGFHLLLILLFHVSPFILASGDVVFPPANVVADTAPAEQGAMAIITPSSQWIRGLPRPPATTPPIAGTPAFTVSRPISKDDDLHSHDTLFTTLEQSLYLPEFNPLKKSDSPRFSMKMSGMLSRLTIVDGMPQEAAVMSGEIGQVDVDTRAVYAVMVDGRSGKIFWYEPIERSAKSKIDKTSEKILSQLTFAKNPLGSSTSGEMEFHFKGNRE